MSCGRYPSCRHDRSAFGEGDELRAAMAGQYAGKLACILIKGDLSEFANTFGFPDFSNPENPCLWCQTDKEHLCELDGFSPISMPAPPKTWATYNAACLACEIVVLIGSREMLLRIRASLRYDKRKQQNAYHGRALIQDLPDINLRKGDRLEPSPDLPDVGMLDEASVPITVIFWRTANETAARHRNPLFDESIGLVPSLVMANDFLHCCALGVFQFLLGWFLHMCIRKNIWGVFYTTVEVLITSSVQCFKADLFEWYGNEEKQALWGPQKGKQ